MSQLLCVRLWCKTFKYFTGVQPCSFLSVFHIFEGAFKVPSREKFWWNFFPKIHRILDYCSALCSIIIVWYVAYLSNVIRNSYILVRVLEQTRDAWLKSCAVEPMLKSTRLKPHIKDVSFWAILRFLGYLRFILVFMARMFLVRVKWVFRIGFNIFYGSCNDKYAP